MEVQETQVNRPTKWAWVAVATLALVLAGLTLAKAASFVAVNRLDIVVVVACDTEDGDAQTHPCVWDAATMGNRRYTGPRYLVWYLEHEGCPVKPTADVACLAVPEPIGSS